MIATSNLILGILVALAGVGVGALVAVADYKDARTIAIVIGSLLAGHIVGTVSTKTPTAK